MLSNRNYDRSVDYVLLQRDVKVKVKTKKDDIIERAVDKATKSVNGGEFLMNTSLWVSGNGKKMIVKTDVWGIKPIENSNTSVNVVNTVEIVNEFKVGNTVTFKVAGKTFEGKILGINSNGAIVEFINPLKKLTKKEVKFDDLTKIER